MALKTKAGAVLSTTQSGLTHSTNNATSSSDLNDTTDPNVEYYTTTSTQNKPTVSGSYHVWNHRINSSAVLQMASLKGISNPLYMRHYNGSWGDWEQIARLKDIYPVGSIYRTTSSSMNPATLYGGTWKLAGSEETISVSKAVEYSTNTHTIGIVTLDQLTEMFENEYGYTTDFTRTYTYDKDVDGTTTSVTESYYDIGISMYNHDWAKANIVIDGYLINDDDIIYAYVNNPGNGHWTAVFTTHRPMYQWERTA